ncbi:MAG: bifunctional heptose 7-phosphate kinase/heptose 1-phosphate adenyltransferase [Anaerolineae bacterium]
MVNKQTLLQALEAIPARRVLVLGDVLLDEYLIGQARRLSREAPIPILEFEERRTLPGGAANPAMVVAALEARATMVGLIGADDAGRELVAALRAANVDASGIVTNPARQTTQKTRIVSQGSLRFPQQLARLDRLDRRPPAPDDEAALIEKMTIAAPLMDAFVVSDYRLGMLAKPLVQTALDLSARHGFLLVVDSQGELDKYRGFDVIRANRPDTARFLGRPLETEANFEAATAELLARLQARAVVISRGADGVSLRGHNTPYTHYPAANRSEVFDVTGAGDASTATLALGISAGLNLAEAAGLANYAGGLVVRRLGNATPSREELRWAIEHW